MFAAGVVEVLAGGKNFDSLGAGAAGEFQQAGVEAFFQKDVGG